MFADLYYLLPRLIHTILFSSLLPRYYYSMYLVLTSSALRFSSSDSGRARLCLSIVCASKARRGNKAETSTPHASKQNYSGLMWYSTSAGSTMAVTSMRNVTVAIYRHTCIIFINYACLFSLQLSGKIGGIIDFSHI